MDGTVQMVWKELLSFLKEWLFRFGFIFLIWICGCEVIDDCCLKVKIGSMLDKMIEDSRTNRIKRKAFM
jgi:hypothetical protein